MQNVIRQNNPIVSQHWLCMIVSTITIRYQFSAQSLTYTSGVTATELNATRPLRKTPTSHKRHLTDHPICHGLLSPRCLPMDKVDVTAGERSVQDEEAPAP